MRSDGPEKLSMNREFEENLRCKTLEFSVLSVIYKQTFYLWSGPSFLWPVLWCLLSTFLWCSAIWPSGFLILTSWSKSYCKLDYCVYVLISCPLNVMTSSLTVFNTAGSRAVHPSPPAAPAPSCSPSLSPRGWSAPAPPASTTPPRGWRRPRGRAHHDRRSWPTSSRTWRATSHSPQKWGDQEARTRPGLSIPIPQYIPPHILTSIILIIVFCYHISTKGSGAFLISIFC